MDGFELDDLELLEEELENENKTKNPSENKTKNLKENSDKEKSGKAKSDKEKPSTFSITPPKEIKNPKNSKSRNSKDDEKPTSELLSNFLTQMMNNKCQKYFSVWYGGVTDQPNFFEVETDVLQFCKNAGIDPTEAYEGLKPLWTNAL